MDNDEQSSDYVRLGILPIQLQERKDSANLDIDRELWDQFRLHCWGNTNGDYPQIATYASPRKAWRTF